ncbi:phosphoribosyltransferase [Devosia beringensis]|uniref:phosphoribosyltransferase n=1 Tax=Devosia beringensis TaxID=2657486 RepID=UPI00186BA6D2|nr:phosphoribosyltransferase [Devosia beringensis]
MTLAPHHFWQTLDAPGTHEADATAGWVDGFPAALPDGRQLLLPIRVLPGDGHSAVASLIINQASFAVEDALSAVMAAMLDAVGVDVVIGVPTLGLPLANNVARRLGHTRMVALGTSRKFWYSDDYSAPMTSITSPDQQKTIFLDPRSLPLLEGKRVGVVDDVISSGTSMAAVLTLLERAGVTPVAVAAAMLQGTRWHEPLAAWRSRIMAPLASPRLALSETGRWLPSD